MEEKGESRPVSNSHGKEQGEGATHRGQEECCGLTSSPDTAMWWVVASGANQFEGCGSIFCSVRKDGLSCGQMNLEPDTELG